MEYSAPAIPSTIPKDPNRDKPEEPSETAKETAKPANEPAKPIKDPTKNAALEEESLELFALNQDFEEDPVHQLVADNLYAIPAHRRGRLWKTTDNAVEVVSKPYAVQVQETCFNENPNISSNVVRSCPIRRKIIYYTV
ncbi:hypothetical protein DSO57_1007893 [Entomophthora muscae]|uniref:Uncharacterized protein n=1 Tax=Entomophthora muscae TaxID=34485 RepID=A0ACC2SK55_9FUNG|nr:hypothetical protein DSO57_1007893 [Entomophthora muscae]